VTQTPAAPAKRANISPVVVNKVARGRPGRPPGSGKAKGRPGRPPGSGKKPAAAVAPKQRATPEAAAVSTSAPIAQVKQWEKELDGLYTARAARFGEALGDVSPSISEIASIPPWQLIHLDPIRLQETIQGECREALQGQVEDGNQRRGGEITPAMVEGQEGECVVPPTASN
jgi:hypothetical protein